MKCFWYTNCCYRFSSVWTHDEQTDLVVQVTRVYWMLSSLELVQTLLHAFASSSSLALPASPDSQQPLLIVLTPHTSYLFNQALHILHHTFHRLTPHTCKYNPLIRTLCTARTWLITMMSASAVCVAWTLPLTTLLASMDHDSVTPCPPHLVTHSHYIN